MQKILHKCNYPLVTALVCLILYLVFLQFLLEKRNRDITSFIHAGSTFTNENELAYPIQILQNSDGYDGQFYYRLSLNPFTHARVDDGIMLDNPRYRQQRILYPFITSLLSINPAFIPYVMVWINLFFITIIAFYGGIIAQLFNKHALWGIIFTLWPGFLFTFSRNLTEIVAIAFLLSGISHFYFKNYILSGVLLALAILSKETTLIVPVSIFLAVGFEYFKNKKKKILFTGLIPLFTYGFWQLWIYQNWQHKWSAEVGNNIGIPFLGIIEFIKSLYLLPIRLQITSIVELIYIAVIILFTFISIFKTKFLNVITYSWLLYVLLAILLTKTVWVEDIAFMRALTELFIIGILIIFQTKNIYKYIFPLGMLIWIYMIIDILKYR